MQAGGKPTKTAGVDLTAGPIMRSLLLFSLPLILSSVVQQLYTLADLMIVGKYVGAIGTVGVSTGGEFNELSSHIALCFAGGGQVYVAQLFGAGDHPRIRETVGTLLSVMTLMSLVLFFITFVWPEGILQLLNCPAEALAEAKVYMRITAVSIPFIFGYNAICGVLRGMGESQRPLEFILVAALVNVGLDLLLVLGLGCGVAGAAAATLASQCGSFLAALFYLYRHRDYFGLELKLSYFKIRRQPLLVILKLGIPNLVRALAVQFSMLWVKAMVNDYGLVISATNSVGGKIEKFVSSVTISVNTASGAMMGQNIGAKKQKRAAQTIWCTFVYSMVLGGIAAALCWLIPKPLFSLFTSDAQVIEYGVTFLHIYSVTFLVAAYSIAFKSVINGVGAAMLGFWLGLLDGCVCRIGISLFCLNTLGLGAESYFWGTAFTQLLPGVIAMLYFLTGAWKKKKLLSEEA